VLVAEDAGDTPHSERGRFDSLYAIRTDVNYVRTTSRCVSCTWVVTLRRRPTRHSRTSTASRTRATNEGTGIHVPDGNPTVAGLLGVKVPHAFEPGSRWRSS
jgi:hypothetical protein